MNWSAAAWTIGRTVVDPLILRVCFCPDEAGELVFNGAAVVVWTVGLFAGEAAMAVAAAVGEATGA